LGEVLKLTKQEFSDALTLANSDAKLDGDLSVFEGFGLEGFKPVYCTVEQVASLIRYQCLQFNGNLDSLALNEIGRHGKRKFIII
jgi:hypothetical protein